MLSLQMAFWWILSGPLTGAQGSVLGNSSAESSKPPPVSTAHAPSTITTAVTPSVRSTRRKPTTAQVTPSLVVPLATQGALTADQVVDKVQRFYQETTAMQRQFRQTVTNATFGTKRVSDGYVFLKKPGKMRWEYYSKKRAGEKQHVVKSFLSDGTHLWAVFYAEKEFYQKKLEDDVLPVAVTFLTGQGDLRRDFAAELDNTTPYGTKGDYVLKLSPKTPAAQYKTLWLVVDPSDFRVKESVVLNHKKDTNHFSFFAPKHQKAVTDSMFVFSEQAAKGYTRMKQSK